jgi:myo-inositol 2-dehydrogenase / D-chiro-inositol 1-dehydrogenase
LISVVSIGVVGVVLLLLATDFRRPPMHTARIALLGVGRIGTVHYENLRRNPNAQLTYIADVNVARAQELAAAVPGCTGVTTFDDILANEASVAADAKLHAVIVCTPTLTHYDLVIRALEAGLGVFVEKPLSLDIVQIDTAYALAASKGVPLLTGKSHTNAAVLVYCRAI